MKILRLEIKGFRSLRDVVWEPADLNVVIGPNGTGKSNLLRMLQMISIAAKGGLGKYVQSSGGMETLVWDGTSKEIEFILKTELMRESLTYSVNMTRLGKKSTYYITFEELAKCFPVERKNRSKPLRLLYRTENEASFFDEKGKDYVVQEESVPEDETLLSMSGGLVPHNHYVRPFQRQLSNLCIYHDFHVDSEAKIRQSIVPRPEEIVEADGQNLMSVLHTLYTGNREFKKDINDAMLAAFGNDFENLDFSPVADRRIELRVFWKTRKRPDSAADISDGMLRFLFLLTVFASPSPLIAIDEPETGLHPSMLPIVAEYAVEASQRAQIILTTHSPEFLDAFGESKPATTVATWSDGQTLLKKLEGEALEYWLKEYSLGSMFRSGELESM